MTLSDDIKQAEKRLEQAVRHLLGAPDMFNGPPYNGLYKGHKIKLRYSKYIKKCRGNVKIAKKKLRTLERKLWDIRKIKKS